MAELRLTRGKRLMWSKAKVSTRIEIQTIIRLRRLAYEIRVPLADLYEAAILTSAAEPHRMLHYLGVADPDALVGPPENRRPLPPAPPLGRIGRAWLALKRFNRFQWY